MGADGCRKVILIPDQELRLRKPEGLADERYGLLPTEHTLEEDRFREGVCELGWVGRGVLWDLFFPQWPVRSLRVILSS